jgi:hypothetical protein
MNLFKGVLYLIDHDERGSADVLEARRYGAATAAEEFVSELGNRAASARRFGRAAIAAEPAAFVELKRCA